MENKIRFIIKEMVDNFFAGEDIENMSDDEISAFIQFQIDKSKESKGWKKDVEAGVNIPTAMPTAMSNLNEKK